MQVTFDCPKCLKAETAEVASSTTALGCRQCGWTHATPLDAIAIDVPQHCLVCDCPDLWRQKDFPPQLGLLMVGLGILLSTIAIAYMRPVLAIGILMSFALVDMLLFVLMKDRLVCYRCHSVYRNVGPIADHEKFDLERHERYRQESLRRATVEASQPPRH